MAANVKDQSTSKFAKHFVIEKCIGQGTFSSVYRVRSIKNKKKYALKKVFVDNITNENHRANCFNEVNLLQKASHPNVIQFFCCEYNQSKTDGALNLILELAPAGDLHEFISNHAKKVSLIPEKKIWRFTSQLSSGLSYLHSCRIMHRDLKPANIYLSKSENIKIGDFGLGKHCLDSTELFATSVLGSPYYMSPERLLQEKYFLNCDIWSLGCVIYELAALQSPFYVNKLDINLLIKRVVKCDYPPLPSDAYSEELQRIIGECLTVDHTKRPNAELVLALVTQEIEKRWKNENN